MPRQSTQKSTAAARAPTANPKSTRKTHADPDAENEPAESVRSSKIIVKLKIPAKRLPGIQPPAPEEATRNKKQKKTAVASPLADTTELTAITPALQYNKPWEPSYSVLESVAQSSKMNTLRPSSQPKSPLQASSQDHSVQQLRRIPSNSSIDPVLFQTPSATRLKPPNDM
ncbi:hypothetical protein IW261DRAFT_1428059 [Armillaria novae-zelandiae]|uniref:Uncharacterized protein n=1 Tax=Armillaria novae-zelandiae TaxID=153914 RepID=A0AA39NBR7_9AGAR|nr:hypothetical protein IW261DRAFT_1428059 [Armillaria novae-zelandiae]